MLRWILHKPMHTERRLYAITGVADKMHASDYPEFNYDNLTTTGMLSLDYLPFIWMHKRHPVYTLLSLYPDAIAFDITTHPLIDNEWLKLQRVIFEVCCMILQEDLFLPEDDSHDPVQARSNHQPSQDTLGNETHAVLDENHVL